MKIATYLLGLAGLTGCIVLVSIHGWGAVAQVFAQGGWRLLWLIPFHAVPLLLDTIGWRVLVEPSDPSRRAPTRFLLWVAAVREAVSRLLPVASIGGDLVGIRLVIFRGLSGAGVTASVLIEILLTMLNQYVFAAIGLLILMRLTQATPLISTILLGLALSLPIFLGVFAFLRYGAVFERVERIAQRVLSTAKLVSVSSASGKGLDVEIRKLLRQRARLARCMSWQFACYLVGSFETWLALRMLGHAVSPWAAVALEAMTQAVRHFMFFVPAGLGVQEGGLILFGQLIGLPIDFAIALSLTKRVRELLIGIPALMSWQWVEILHMKTQGSRDAAAAMRTVHSGTINIDGRE